MRFDATTRLFEGSAEPRTIQVGHSYFLSDGAAATVDDDADVIARRFAYEVVPLLFEYEAEGRFQVLGLDALFDDLALLTRPPDGAVNQVDLVAEVRDRILAGTLGAPPSAAAVAPGAPAATVAEAPAPADSDAKPAPAADDNPP